MQQENAYYLVSTPAAMLAVCHVHVVMQAPEFYSCRMLRLYAVASFTAIKTFCLGEHHEVEDPKAGEP